MIKGVKMKVITYLESCNMFFAPLDEIIEAVENQEGVNCMSYNELVNMINSNLKLKFYVENFETHCNLM